MKIGLIGGSFDPVHLGHLRAAEEIRERLDLKEVVFIPARVSPHKTSAAADSFHRLNILNLSIEDNPHFSVSDIELREKPPSYTINTLKLLKKRNPLNDYYFMLGSELFAAIDTWKNFRELFTYASFVVIRRPGHEDSTNPIPLALREDFRYSYGEDGKDVFIHASSNKLFFIDIAGIRVSSTEIRELARTGGSLKFLVARKAEEYIVENGLYKSEEKP